MKILIWVFIQPVCISSDVEEYVENVGRVKVWPKLFYCMRSMRNYKWPKVSHIASTFGPKLKKKIMWAPREVEIF